jgi:pimeloyl-ACP methyl ester carboxylesterase
VRRQVLYFHGFASSPHSRKVIALRELLEPDGIALDAPDLNVPSFERLDFDAIVDLGVARGRANPPRAIAGSSLGALVALAVAKSIDAPLVLIAPALGIAARWIDELPAGDPIRVFNHALGEEASIHRAFFEGMARVDVDREPPKQPVTVIAGRNDESVGFENVERVWRAWEASGRLAAGSRLIDIPNGDHSLVGFVDVIAEAVRRATGR